MLRSIAEHYHFIDYCFVWNNSIPVLFLKKAFQINIFQKL